MQLRKNIIFIGACVLLLLLFYITGYISFVIENPYANIIEMLLLIFFGIFFWRNYKFSQPLYAVFVKDDTKITTVKDLVIGKSDELTKLYADCAVLSANIYNMYKEQKYMDYDEAKNSKYRISTNWVELTDLNIDRVGNIQDNKLGIEVWKNSEYKLVAIVFRGTVKGINSWIANLHWIIRWLPIRDQYDEIREIVPLIISELNELLTQGYQIISTGHSLGGGLAQHANYLNESIKNSFVFNSSPVTGWSDVDPEEREKNVTGSRIYRMYERGEILHNLRFFINISYLMNPKPNQDPFFVEHRLNLMRTGAVTSHGIQPLAYGLRDIVNADVDSTAKYNRLN